MNIIQVGRPAVSRYHQIHKFDPVGEGPDFAVHDFPNAQYGIKFWGIYVQEWRQSEGGEEGKVDLHRLHVL